ncbi:MAG TPA: dihydrofolate reductase family protein [Kofleriaceae bacterium]|nr:dihydrofolate reductase family protein [Kofleriaceae bacterium]
MRRLTVFNNISLDGYFTDRRGDMTWAHKSKPDPEWDKFSAENAQSSEDGALLFGRKTYELMVAFWPTPAAAQQMPEVADGMNRLAKFVVSRSLDKVTWNNTTLIKGDLAAEVRKLKAGPGSSIVVMGSGTIVAQLAKERLIDQYTFVVTPNVLGAGRTLFDGLEVPFTLTRTSERTFRNGNVVVTYEPQ